MDYLNPKKQFRHRVMLLVGYVLIGVAVVLSTWLLVEVASGYWVNEKGAVIQNGLVFFSSQPHPAQIQISGMPHYNGQTNTRVLLPGGIYHIQLTRNGYRTWQRTIEVNGDSVEHFDYPLLFPEQLAPKPVHPYLSAPVLATQSPDLRWGLVLPSVATPNFDLYDLKNPTKAPTVITLPATIVSKAVTSESWQVGEWADDNQHVLLQHVYDGKTEFILLDRATPDQSQNLSQTLDVNPTQLTLNNKKYDQYYLYNAADQSLQTASRSSHTALPLLTHVLAYHTYGNNVVLYATDSGAPAGKVLVKLLDNGQTYDIHTLLAGTTYLLNLTQYNGTFYVAVGASSENKVYIYRDPVGQLSGTPGQAVVPIQVLHVSQPNYVSFSTNAQFIMVEGGTYFGVYDIENKLGYNYTNPAPLDAPQVHASWMDGDRLTYVSGGRLVVFDYDHTNQQILMPASSSYLPFFAPDYSFVDTLAPATTPDQAELTSTSLFTPADKP
jgi:hypothetical protein